MIKKVLVLILIFATMLPSLFAETNALEAARGRPEPPPFVANQVLINFQPWISTADIATFYAKHGLVEREGLGARPGRVSRLRLAQVKPGKMKDHDGFIRTLEEDSRVEYAELNYTLSIALEPDDPDYSLLWGLNNTGQSGGTADADIDAPEAWDITTGSADVIVGIIDTGVNYNHQDLIANMWTNPGEIPGDGKDNDNNGYIDDIHGINAITNSGDPMDDHYHGSHTAGTIGATGWNEGVVGVNWRVSIAACKFLNAGGSGSTSGAIKCFNYFNQLRADGHNVLVTNNSWGGGPFSQSLKDAMAGDILHTAAAGNGGSDGVGDNNDTSPHYPSNYDLPNIISVAATDRKDNYAGFSNFGQNSVDLAGPGVSIRSTVLANGYGTISGTSMATPHVAGGAALVWSAFPAMTALQVKAAILAGVDSVADNKKPTLTDGRLNVFNTLSDLVGTTDGDAIAPAAVADLAVSANGMSLLTLSWTATGDDGNTGTASFYDVRYSTSPISNENWGSATQATGEPAPQSSGSTETFTVYGLDPSSVYHLALRVRDNLGNESGMLNPASGATTAASTVFEDNMSAPGDWTGTGLWNQDTFRSVSPDHAWYYGQPGTRNYDTGGTNSGTLTSVAMDLTNANEAILTFQEWTQVESLASYDRTRVQASSNGNTWATIFESHGTSNLWVERAVDLTPYIGGNVYLRFKFETIDSIFNNYEGWYIDDVMVITDVPAATGTIMGTVTQGSDGPALQGALVVVDGMSLSATTGADGGYSIDNVPPDTYSVTASAFGFENMTETGVVVASTAVVDFPMVALDTTPPAAPSGLVATPGDGKVDLVWGANSETDLAGYNVYRSDSDVSPYVQVNSALVVATVWEDTGLVNGNTYYYVVRAEDTSTNESSNSNEASAMPEAPADTTPPAAPSGLVATAGDGKVDLVWAANSETDLAGYNVYRSSSAGGTYAQVNTALVASNGWEDTGLVNGNTYYYVVRAEDTSTNESSNSNEASAMPEAPVDTTPPAAPSGLVATPGDGKVDLAWGANSETDLAGYNVYRSSSAGGTYAQVNTALVASNGWEDTGLVNGNTYYYVVRAEDTSTNESGNSNEASAMPEAPAAGVSVDNIAPWSIPRGDTAVVSITGSGFAAGASVTFENGTCGPAPQANVTDVSPDGTTITVTVTTGNGPKKKNCMWDVRVTNPDNSTDVSPGGLTITKL